MPPDPAAPRLHYPFDGDLANLGATQFPAAAYGDEVDFVPGVLGLALSIGGTSDWVDVEIDEKLELAGGFTIELWVNHPAWDNPYEGSPPLATVLNIDGVTLRLWTYDLADWTLAAEIGPLFPTQNRTELRHDVSPLAADTWYHVAITFDAPTATAVLYLDGAAVVTASGVAAPNPGDQRANPLRIGTWFETNQACRGLIDELRIYDFPISAAQLSASLSLEP